jgi:hypothetical protein
MFLSAVIRVLVGAVGDSSSAVQEAAAASLRENAHQCVFCYGTLTCPPFMLAISSAFLLISLCVNHMFLSSAKQMILLWPLGVHVDGYVLFTTL